MLSSTLLLIDMSTNMLGFIVDVDVVTDECGNRQSDTVLRIVEDGGAASTTCPFWPDCCDATRPSIHCATTRQAAQTDTHLLKS